MQNISTKNTIIILVILLVMLVAVGFYTTKDKEEINETNQIPIEEQHWFQIPENCDDVQGTEQQDSCYQSKAVAESDASYCANIQADSFFVSKDACYSQVAVKTKDNTLCEKIERSEFKENCLEVASSNDENTSQQCIVEGDYGVPGPFSAPCCEGLTSISCDKLNTEGKCVQCDGTFICTKCGDGVCGKSENVCNCEKDCLEFNILYSE